VVASGFARCLCWERRLLPD